MTDINAKLPSPSELSVLISSQPAAYESAKRAKEFADKAAISEANAATSASSADNSKVASSESENAAEASATSAASSATSAAASATSAVSSATSAASSATSAAASATSASGALSQLNSELNNTIPTLVDGKLNPSQIPAISIVSVVTVASTAQMTQLTPQQVQQGDICRIVVDGVITDTYSLGSSDPSVLSNWMKYGQGYVAEAGHAAGADTAGNADMIDGHHMVSMTQAEYDSAVIDGPTIYLVG